MEVSQKSFYFSKNQLNMGQIVFDQTSQSFLHKAFGESELESGKLIFDEIGMLGP